MFSERVISLSCGRRNACVSAGDAPPLLMLHGVTRRWQTFLPLVPALQTRWQLHMLDFRGHGQSEPVPQSYRVVDYLGDARAYLREQLSASAVVYGHSLGAMVALHLAAEEPGRVRALVLEDPPFETMGQRIAQTDWLSLFIGYRRLAGGTESVAEMAAALANVPVGRYLPRPLGELRDALSLRFTARCLKMLDPDVLEPIVAGQWLEGYDLRDILRRVRCPVLLLQADVASGGMLYDDDARALLDQLPDCVQLRFPGAAHLLHWQQTDSIARHVISFLESLDPQA